VPLIVVHPAHARGQALQGGDLPPRLRAAEAGRKAAITKALPGKDFSALLAAPEKAGPGAIRDGMLFCYNMFAYIDGDFLEKSSASFSSPAGRRRPRRPSRRVRCYFSPKQHNRPDSFEALVKLNDIELFDLQTDPLELDNLALDRKHRDLLDAMSAKLNALIDKEVGEDLGQMLPGGVDGGWVVTGAVNDV
jgi:hypothetical protein